MKTTIIEELDLPEERREAISREAMRQGKPANQLVKEWLLAKADQIIAAAEQTKKAA
mgnify:CR=1 FL=1